MKYIILVFLYLSILAGCSTTAPDGNPSPSKDLNDGVSEKIIPVPFSMFVDSRNFQHKEFIPSLISPSMASQVKLKLRSLADFPGNSYSGCHARAHFDYMQVKSISDNKVYKIWLFSSSLISPALRGGITYTPKNGNSAYWDYHVAAAYTDSSGSEWIIDRLISPDPIFLSDWLKNFDIDGYAILTRVSPEYYLFNITKVPLKDPIEYPKGFLAHLVPKNVFNGTFYTYTGLTLKEHWGASDMAVDALSFALQNGVFSSCKWKNSVSNTKDLKSMVQSSSVPNECAGAQSLFLEQFKLWKSRGL